MLAESALVALIAFGQVDVRSNTDCPSARAIAEQVDPLLSGVSGHDAADVQLLGTLPDGARDLQVTLFERGLAPMGRRQISVRGSCAEMAEAVAAILAAWKSNPGTNLPGAPPGPISVPQQTIGSSEVTRPSRFESFAGVGLAAHGVGGAALGGSAELRFGVTASHWQARLAFTTQMARQLDLRADAYNGHVDWQHSSFGLGLAWRSLSPRWQLWIDGGVVAGWATVQGHGFADNRTERSFEYGAAAGVRGGPSWGRLALWLEARPTLWLKGHEVRVAGSTAAEDLPVVDVAVSLGLSVRLLP